MLSLGVTCLTRALHGQCARERCLFGGLYRGRVLWIDAAVAHGSFGSRLQRDGHARDNPARGVGRPDPGTRSGRWAGGWWALTAALVLLEAIQLRCPLGGFPLPGLALTGCTDPIGAVEIILAPSSSVPHSPREPSQLSTSQSSKAVATTESSPTPLESPHVTLP